jgi:2-haloacid dehalogenase
MRYTTIFLDADDTLFDFKKAEEHALSSAFHTFHLPYAPQILLTFSKINQALWQKFEAGSVTRADLQRQRFSDLFEQFNITGIDPQAFHECYLEGLADSTFLLDGAVELCRTLSKTCSLYIVTNGTIMAQTKRLASSEIHPYIKEMYISEAIGYQKPQKEFFDYVLSHIPPVDRRDCILLGDSLTSDIKGGQNAGIDTCYVSPTPSPEAGYTYHITALLDFIPIVMG